MRHGFGGRLFRRSASLLLLLGLIGCGENPEAIPGGGSGATAGSGGGGGAGGTAGSGGTGGTGGTLNTCGDGRIDVNEECDDANQHVGDGCSDTCALEGTCANPLDFLTQAVPEGDQLNVHGFLPRRDGSVEGSCGGKGAELVYRYRVPGAGIFRFGVASGNDQAVAYARTDCTESESEMECGLSGAPQTITTTGATEYHIVVDGAGQEGTEFVLAIYFSPYRQEGESCDATVLLCAPGLLCAGRKCVVDGAPTIANPRALRGGASGGDLVLVANGTDDYSVYAGFAVQLFDQADQLLDLAIDDPRWNAELKHLVVPFGGTEPSPAGSSFQAWGVREGLLADYPEIAHVRLGIKDRNNLSEMLPTTLAHQPERQHGEACERDVPLDRCAAGFWCWESARGTTCQAPAVLRAAACAGSAIVVINSSTVLAAPGPSLWEPPDSCWESQPAEQGLPEGLARLELEADVATLRITTDHASTRSSTLLSLFSGCGETAPPLVCDHHMNEPIFTSGASEVIMESVPAGSYLIAVESTGGLDFGLTVSAE